MLLSANPSVKPVEEHKPYMASQAELELAKAGLQL